MGPLTLSMPPRNVRAGGGAIEERRGGGIGSGGRGVVVNVAGGVRRITTRPRNVASGRREGGALGNDVTLRVIILGTFGFMSKYPTTRRADEINIKAMPRYYAKQRRQA